jgi:hypothetical protein
VIGGFVLCSCAYLSKDYIMPAPSEQKSEGGRGPPDRVWLRRPEAADPGGTVLGGPQGLASHLICGGVYDWRTGLLYKGGRYAA